MVFLLYIAGVGLSSLWFSSIEALIGLVALCNHFSYENLAVFEPNIGFIEFRIT
jgi:hypothetical protein